jgi:hypothetical protein
LVVDEVHGPGLVGRGGPAAVLAQLGFHQPLCGLVAQLQPRLIVKAVNALVV